MTTEAQKRAARRCFRKKCIREPGWNAERQRKWRAEHPQDFYFCMCKTFFKRLTKEQKEKLIREVGL